MSKTMKYDVLREHEGDRFYRTGETRDLPKDEAAHLVALGVLRLHVAAKAEKPAANKAEHAPKNK